MTEQLEEKRLYAVDVNKEESKLLRPFLLKSRVGEYSFRLTEHTNYDHYSLNLNYYEWEWVEHFLNTIVDVENQLTEGNISYKNSEGNIPYKNLRKIVG